MTKIRVFNIILISFAIRYKNTINNHYQDFKSYININVLLTQSYWIIKSLKVINCI